MKQRRRVRPELIRALVTILVIFVATIVTVFFALLFIFSRTAVKAFEKIEEEAAKPINHAFVVENAKLVEKEPTFEEVEITDHSVGICEITAYCTCVDCCGIWSKDHPIRQGTDYVQYTKSGTVPTEGRTVAVDPDVIPIGSIVIIDGVSFIAEDTGNFSGKTVDIYFDSHEEAKLFGRQTATVHYIY
jgi:3D (Asp-Asp-Asp) domain-containing protein